jgi:hypothetical protein
MGKRGVGGYYDRNTGNMGRRMMTMAMEAVHRSQ